MIPESKYIKNELTLRDMALPDEVKLTRKSLVRWLALSLGLISPNESRMLMLDLLDVLFYFHVKQESPTTQRILDRLEEVTGEKPNPKAVYYHLLKLKEAGIISRKKGNYSIGEGEWARLQEHFRALYSKRTDEAFEKIDEAFSKLESSYER
jgi:DNA-binding PadR family transcriptional regulator